MLLQSYHCCTIICITLCSGHRWCARYLQDVEHDVQVGVCELSLTQTELLEVLHDRQRSGKGFTPCNLNPVETDFSSIQSAACRICEQTDFHHIVWRLASSADRCAWEITNRHCTTRQAQHVFLKLLASRMLSPYLRHSMAVGRSRKQKVHCEQAQKQSWSHTVLPPSVFKSGNEILTTCLQVPTFSVHDYIGQTDVCQMQLRHHSSRRPTLKLHTLVHVHDSGLSIWVIFLHSHHPSRSQQPNSQNLVTVTEIST